MAQTKNTNTVVQQVSRPHNATLMLMKARKAFQWHLPQELVDLIVDQLRDNPSALAMCSLISRAWVPRSRHHLFRCLKISILESYICYDLLSHPLCTFRPCVRAVALKFKDVVEDTKFYRPPEVWIASVLSKLKQDGTVTGFQAEDYRVLGVDCFWEALRTVAPTFTSHITHLRLCEFGPAWFFRFRALVHEFPAITSLYHSTSNPVASHFDPSVEASGYGENQNLAPSSLRSVVIATRGKVCPIQQGFSQFMWSWLLESRTSLSSLRLDGLITIPVGAPPDLQSLVSFRDYLNFLGPSLEVLNLRFRDKLSYIQFFNDVGLQSTTGLHEFEFGNVPLFYDPEKDQFLLPFFFLGMSRLWSKFPQQLNMRKISVILQITPFDVDGLDFFNCADEELAAQAYSDLTTAFTGTLFPNLEELVFVVSLAEDDELDRSPLDDSVLDKVATFLEGNLAKIMERGILTVSRSD